MAFSVLVDQYVFKGVNMTLSQAIKERDRLTKLIKKLQNKKLEGKSYTNQAKKHGMTRVYLRKSMDYRKNPPKLYESVCTHWRVNGVKRASTFSVIKYGRAKAIELAKKKQRQMVKKGY